MIVTVTLNAALDRTVTVPYFQLGTRNRATDALSLPGGKGVNVARALKRIGEPVIATGLAGGPVGTSIIEGLTAEGILNDFVRIREESRTSAVVIDPNGKQTEIISRGPQVAEDELAMFMEKLRYLARGADMFVLSGSLPPGVPDDFYATLVRELKPSAFTALDTEGEALRAGLAAEPDLVSPNAREAEEIVGYEFSEDGLGDMEEAAIQLTSMGAASAIVHRAEGCVARLRQPGSKSGVTYVASLPTREVVSSVGSGDVLLAGYLTGLARHASPKECMALAVACGTANTQRMGAGVFDPKDLEALRRQVEVTLVEEAQAGAGT